MGMSKPPSEIAVADAVAAAAAGAHALTLRIYQDAAVAAQADPLAELCARVFAVFDAGRLHTRLAMHRGWMLVQAEVETEVETKAATATPRPVAFKLGYAETDESFYSWLGGVDPDWRGRGLAQRLIRAQHDWAACAGYRSITTRTQIGNDAMAAINRAAGFTESGILTKADGRRLRAFAKSLV